MMRLEEAEQMNKKGRKDAIGKEENKT